MPELRHGSVNTRAGAADHLCGHGDRQRAHGHPEELQQETGDPRRGESSGKQCRPQGGGRACRAGINCRSQKCKRAAAEAGNSTNSVCVRSTEGSVTPSRIAQGGPPGYPWTPFRQDTAGSGIRGRADAQLHQSRRDQPARGDLIRSYRRALNSGIARAHEAANREADAGGGTLSQSTVCFKRWRNPRLHCCRQLSRCCRSWRKRPEPTGKNEQFTTPHRLPTWRARHSRP
jgi:hypothetical protein